MKQDFMNVDHQNLIPRRKQDFIHKKNTKTSNLFFIIDYPLIKSTINLFFIIFFLLVTLNKNWVLIEENIPLDSQSTNEMVRHHFLIVCEYILQMVKHCALNVVPPC